MLEELRADRSALYGVINGLMQPFLMRIALLSVLLIVLAPEAGAQVSPGVSVQIYPAGQIVQGRAAVQHGPRSEIRLFFGYNRTRRQDFGRMDHEEGGGFGIGADVIGFFKPEPQSLFFGAKLDVWYLNIDWRDVENPCPRDSQCLAPDILLHGDTQILVVQPTAQLGYRLPARGGSLALDLTVALGAEINAYTRGERVGEGAILLVGVAATF